ncbi:L-gulono-1,4-lactone dehydrogenase, partial [Pseudolycoriella hygida]
MQRAWTEYSSYVKYPSCNATEGIRYPKTIDDVVAIIKEAIAKKITVKAFGSRHSQTDIICTEGIPVDMTGLQWQKMNADNTATVGAGTNLHDTTAFLRLYGRAFKTTPAFGNITIGGAIGTGAHGSTIKYNASISSQVASVKIVDGKGEVREITDAVDLKAFKLHLGLLGVIVEVTLNTVPLYKTYAFNKIVSDDILTNGEVVQMAQNADQMSLYWFPEFKEVVIANWTVVDANTSGTDYTNDHVPSTYDNFALVASLTKEIAFSLTDSKCSAANTLGYTITHMMEYFLEMALVMPLPDWVPIYATQEGYFRNPSVGYYDEMIAPICQNEPQGILATACVWSHGSHSITILDNDLELSRLGDFIKAVKKIVEKTPTSFPIQGILLRFSDNSDIYMSTAYGRQTVHFEFYLWNRDDIYNNASGSLAGYQTILQTLVNEFNGRSHWGKSGLVYHSSDSIDKKLDETARTNFIDVMNKYDPNGVFMNNFGRRLRRESTKIDVDPRTTR